MQIFIASEADIETLTRVEIQSKMDSVPDLIDPIEVDFPRRLNRWKTYFRGESPGGSKPERIIYKALKNNEIIGYIACHLTSRYGMEAEIQSFYILKEHQRQGIGFQLLKKILEWLETQNAKSVCVGIAPENPYRAFYLKYGGKHLNPHWIFWELP